MLILMPKLKHAVTQIYKMWNEVMLWLTQMQGKKKHFELHLCNRQVRFWFYLSKPQVQLSLDVELIQSIVEPHFFEQLP